MASRLISFSCTSPYFQHTLLELATMANATTQLGWETVVQKKRELQAAAIAPFRSTGEPINSESITSIDDVSKLASRIASGQLKAYDVTLAYIQR